MNNTPTTKESFPAHINGTEIQSVQDHSLNTAAYARMDLETIGLADTAYLAGLLHDCGKFTEEFKDYITGKNLSRKASVIHSFAGVYYILKRYHDSGDSPYGSLTAELIAYAIGAHHGLFDCIDEDHTNLFEYRLSRQPEYEERAIKNYIESCCDKDELDRLFQNSVQEINNVASIIGKVAESDDETFFYLGLLTRLLSAAVMDGDRRDTAEFMNHEDFSRCIKATPDLWRTARRNLEQYTHGLPVETAIQKARREISDICFDFAKESTGIYRLNVPTGGGKTLSSLRYALAHAEKYCKKRIIYAAPFISILDQNADVIKKAVQNDEIILEHHSNIVREDGSAKQTQLSKFELLVDTWDAPIIVTTLVQLLNTFFAGKTSCVRRFQSLCDSIIIIDEVQSVPDNILSLFNLTLNFLCHVCNVTIILCSATQPCLENLPHELKISCPQNIVSEANYQKYYTIFKRTELIDRGNYKLNEIPRLIDEILEERNSLLVVCNTKSEAAYLYSKVESKYDNSFHLSAAMCITHRKDTLGRIYASLESGEKTVCVATQVIEAGVDISFESVIRLTAGVDSLVQSAGRCNRNGENEVIAPVYIVRCADEKLGSLTDIANAQIATNNLLDCYEGFPENYDHDLASDKAVSFYYRSLYKLLPKDYHDYPLKNLPSLFTLLSDNHQFAEGSNRIEKYTMRQAFKLAGSIFDVFDKDGASIVVPYGKGKDIINELCTSQAQYDIAYLKELLRKAKQYSISIYSSQLTQLEKTGAVTAVCNGEVLVLNSEWYDKNIGLMKEPSRKPANKKSREIIINAEKRDGTR